MSNPNWVASADIQPSVFVMISGEHQIATATAGAETVGVMHESTFEAALPGATANPPAVLSGFSKRVYGLGESCEIVAAAAITAGQKLAPDANGQAVVASASARYGAVARGDAAIGDKVQAYIERGTA